MNKGILSLDKRFLIQSFLLKLFQLLLNLGILSLVAKPLGVL